MAIRETKADRAQRRDELVTRLAVLDLVIKDTEKELESLERYMFERNELEEKELTWR